jgi:hypothetical protein
LDYLVWLEMSSRIQLKNPEASGARTVKVRFSDVILVASRVNTWRAKIHIVKRKTRGFSITMRIGELGMETATYTHNESKKLLI